MLYIGIDTGVNTGFAVWNSKRKEFLDISTLKLHQALLRVYEYRQQGESVTVIFEDPRQRKWIPREHSLKEQLGRSQGAGSVKRDAKVWEEFCVDMHLPFMMVKPAKGMTKWSEDYFRRITGWTKRTSNHGRDAAVLVYGR